MSSEPHPGEHVTREEALDKLEEMEERYFNLLDVLYEKFEPRLDELEAENEQLHDQVETLQTRVDVLEGDAATTGKETKVSLLVGQAKNLAEDGQRGVVLTARNIRGATGVTRRYAYDLIDDLPDEYHFLRDRDDLQQYGDLQIDKDGQTRGLFVDLEQLHNDPEAVNKFTTRTDENGGSN